MKSNKEENQTGTAAYVDPFDRTIGALHGLPDVSHYAEHRFMVSSIIVP